MRLAVALITILVAAAALDKADGPPAEFRFVRMEYRDHSRARRGFGGYRGWWQQDWPEADVHFTQGIRRLTRIDTGEGIHLPLTDDRVYDSFGATPA